MSTPQPHKFSFRHAVKFVVFSKPRRVEYKRAPTSFVSSKCNDFWTTWSWNLTATDPYPTDRHREESGIEVSLFILLLLRLQQQDR